jgi:acyl carrier protein
MYAGGVELYWQTIPMHKFYEELAQILETEQVDPAQELASFETWDSLAALSITAAVRASYNVVLNSNDLKSAKTAGDLANVIS